MRLALLFAALSIQTMMFAVSTFVVYHCHGWSSGAVSRLQFSSFRGSSLGLRYFQARSFTRPTGMHMMPEGPEVRTLVDQIQKGAIGQRLVDIQFLSGRYVRHGRPRGFEEFASTMTPWFQPHLTLENTNGVDVIKEWNAKGEFIYIQLDQGSNPPAYCKGGYLRSIWITLGMSGRFVNEDAHLEDPRFARWMLELLDTETGRIRKIFYHDQRNFGTLRFCLSREELEEKLDSLGLDILDANGTTEEKFLALVDKQRTDLNVCKFLMDQSKLSGIGNYILSECLYRACVDPFAPLSEISEDKLRRLFQEAQAVAIESYQAQGVTRQGGSYRGVNGDAGSYQFLLQCYGREICKNGKPVLKQTEGPHKRAIWYVEDQLTMPVTERMEKKVPVTPTTITSQKAMHGGYENVDLSSFLQESGWKQALSPSTESQLFQELQDFLTSEERSGAIIYPPASQVFSALNLCPFDKVKVVICGQDPYHGPGQGHGMAFSVQKGVKLPPSLKNIIQEAMDDVSIPAPSDGNLESWAQQGVLLLNAVLTVRNGEANSHKSRGWEKFTDEIIQLLNDKKEKGIVFLLWGNPAAKKASCVDEDKHVVIRTSHPSPLGATKTDSPFLSSRCFSRANAALEEMGHTPIDWTIQ